MCPAPKIAQERLKIQLKVLTWTNNKQTKIKPGQFHVMVQAVAMLKIILGETTVVFQLLFSTSVLNT